MITFRSVFFCYSLALLLRFATFATIEVQTIDLSQRTIASLDFVSIIERLTERKNKKNTFSAE